MRKARHLWRAFCVLTPCPQHSNLKQNHEYMKILKIAIEGEGRLDTGIKEMLGNPDLHSFYMTFKPVSGEGEWLRYLVRKKIINDTVPISVSCDLVINENFVLPMTLVPKVASAIPYKLHLKPTTPSPLLRVAETDDDGN